MKENYALFLLVLITLFSSQNSINAQCAVPPTPTVTATGACGNNFPITPTLTATGASTLQTSWYANSFGGNAVGTGSTYATPSLTAATVFYAAQLSATSNASLTLPSQSSTFSGNSRGYYFTAPVSFVITGVRVPTDASSGNSNIAIVKFQGNVPPPLFAATTNSFDILYLTQNNTSGTGTIAVNIPVYAGEVIGVLGDRGSINSYASGPTTQSLGSNTLILNRLGMQFPLPSTVPQQLWAEASGSISRVELYTTLGCLNSLTAYTVNINPNPTVSIVGGSSPICAGGTVNLTVSGADTYSWSTGASGSTIAPAPAVSTTYTAVGTLTASGCFAMATKVVTVNPNPVISISSPSAICSGNSLSLTASGASTYTWNTGATTASISATPTANITYTASGTNTVTGCVGNTTKSITVNSNPVISISSLSVVCSGNSLSLTASGASTYTWNTGATTASISVTPTINITYTASGTNTVTGCVGNTTQAITVNPNPTVIATSNTSLICVGQSATISSSGASTYSYSPAIPLSGVISPSATTTYTIMGTSLLGCSGMTTLTQSVSLCTGIEANFSNSSLISIYPNPTSGILNINYLSGSTKNLQILDISGRIVLETSVADDTSTLNISNLQSGIYYLKILSTTKVDCLKIVKE